MPSRILAPLEFRVLATVDHLGPVYGLAVWEQVNSRHPIGQGAVYTTLRRLLDKRYVTFNWGEPERVRGGRRKGYYQITCAGRTALATSRAAYR